MISRLAVLTLALAAPALTGAGSDSAAALPPDRQVMVERHIGHLTATGSETCVSRRRIAESVIITDQRILFRASRGLVYDARLNPGCDGMARSPFLPRTRSGGSQLCTGDTIEVTDPMRTASCTIDSFTRWERPAS